MNAVHPSSITRHGRVHNVGALGHWHDAARTATLREQCARNGLSKPSKPSNLALVEWVEVYLIKKTDSMERNGR
jgi:hypothetical protein